MKCFKLAICIWLCAVVRGYCQDNGENDKRFYFTSFLSIGRSTFHTKLDAPSAFPTVEVRVGVGVVKKLNENFDVRTRLTFGSKFKREGFNNSGVVTVGPPFMELDELSSNRNHYFYEIPLILQATLRHPQIGFRAGINFRHFLPNNKAVDPLTGRGDLGLLAGSSYRLTEKISIGIDYCMGLTNIVSSGGSVDSWDYSLKVRNNFAQMSVEFRL